MIGSAQDTVYTYSCVTVYWVSASFIVVLVAVDVVVVVSAVGSKHTFVWKPLFWQTLRPMSLKRSCRFSVLYAAHTPAKSGTRGTEADIAPHLYPIHRIYSIDFCYSPIAASDANGMNSDDILVQICRWHNMVQHHRLCTAPTIRQLYSLRISIRFFV